MNKISLRNHGCNVSQRMERYDLKKRCFQVANMYLSVEFWHDMKLERYDLQKIIFLSQEVNTTNK